MTENKRYSFNRERGHPNFWDNYCDLADCYLTCEDVVNRLNEQHETIKQLKQELLSLRVELDTHKHPLWSTREAERIIKEYKKENEQLKRQNRQLSLIGEKQADFIRSKGFDIKELIDFARDGSND